MAKVIGKIGRVGKVGKAGVVRVPGWVGEAYRGRVVTPFEGVGRTVDSSPQTRVVERWLGEGLSGLGARGAVVERVRREMLDPVLNGMESKDVAVPERLVEAYYRAVSEGDEAVMFADARREGVTPFEWVMDHKIYRDAEKDAFMERWRLSRPTWEGWDRSGEGVADGLRAEYDAIYDRLVGEGSMGRVSEFMDRTGLPLESVIQMMHPNYRSWMARTGTPLLEVTNGGEAAWLDEYGGWRTRDSIDRANGLRMAYRPVEDGGGFGVGDLPALRNSVQSVGNRYPFAGSFKAVGDSGYIGSWDYMGPNPGTVYGTWEPSEPIRYAGRFEDVLGATHRVTVGGRPYFENNAYGGGGGPTFNPINVTRADLGRLRGMGYDWYGQVGPYNQFAFASDRPVVSLIGNSGRFRGYTGPGTSFYGRRGGRLARLFGFHGD